MLELHPTCENFNKVLPADSTEATIYSFERTYLLHVNSTTTPALF